ncbi:MAG: tRNA pseudouridine(55) synthase TruB [bacterium]
MEGFLLIDKPAGPTSHDIVDVVRRLTSERTVGHAGTLDPFATGLLIVAVGRGATKHLSEFVGLDKEYEATIRLGETSTTGDSEGTITPFSGSLGFGMTTKAGRATKDGMTTVAATGTVPKAAGDCPLAVVESILQSFLGPQLQTPPMFSAKKVGGQKLYDLARAGKTIERAPSQITVHELELVHFEWPELKIRTKVSSGTYIRTLGEDIGRKLGFGGYLTQLRRTKIGEYDVNNAVSLDVLKKPGAALPFFSLS